METSTPRPLTSSEVALVRWLLEHGEPHALCYLESLSGLSVVGERPSDCASLDFVTGGSGPMDILADFEIRGRSGGVFLFAREGRLAGLEVYSFEASITELPSPDMLVSLPAS